MGYIKNELVKFKYGKIQHENSRAQTLAQEISACRMNSEKKTQRQEIKHGKYLYETLDLK